MEIMLTRDALLNGYWFCTPYGREWEKYCVVDPKARLIIITATTKIKCDEFLEYVIGGGSLPRFYQLKVDTHYRKLKREDVNVNYEGRREYGPRI